MNAPKPRLVFSNERDHQFYAATVFEVAELHKAFMSMAGPMHDLCGAHDCHQLASLKSNADAVARVANQIKELATHLSERCDKHSRENVS